MEININIGFNEVNQIVKQWAENNSEFEIAINDQLISQNQWNLRIENVFKKYN